MYIALERLLAKIWTLKVLLVRAEKQIKNMLETGEKEALFIY